MSYSKPLHICPKCSSHLNANKVKGNAFPEQVGSYWYLVNCPTCDYLNDMGELGPEFVKMAGYKVVKGRPEWLQDSTSTRAPIFDESTTSAHTIVRPGVTTHTAYPKFIVVDLFCGAGGTTYGFTKTRGTARVIACVNHDPKAIHSHWSNHPEVIHFEEDIRTLELAELILLVALYRQRYPTAKVILWASLECTNYSKAKGGMQRDGDSRTLALHLFRYVHALRPDYIQIENVVEFRAWGPLKPKVFRTDDGYDICKFEWKEVQEPVIGNDGLFKLNADGSCVFVDVFKTVFLGVPDSMKNGQDWLRWCATMKKLGGFTEDWRELNSADFGAYTSRNRLFGIFSGPGLPIAWPEPTHAKNPGVVDLFNPLRKWKAVRDVLDLEDEGKSIFNRKTPLVDASLERIYAGLVKFVAGGKDAFMLKYNSMSADGKHQPPSVDDPCPTVACQNRLGIVNATFLAKYYSGHPASKTTSLDDPASTIKCRDGQSIVNAAFLQKHFSGKPEGKVIPVDGPAGTVCTNGNQSLVSVTPFMLQRNSGDPDAKVFSISGPARTITATGGNQQLVHCSPFIMNTNFNNVGRNINDPAPTLTASRHHPYVVSPTFLMQYYSSGGQLASLEEPGRTLGTKDTIAKIQTSWFDKTYSGSGNVSSIESPAGVIMPNEKHRLIQCEELIMNPSHGGHSTSIMAPCPTIVASQHKAPLYLIQVTVADNVCIPVYDDDSEVMIRIKIFMALYGIGDIKMRMLKVSELLMIQGFPADYHLEGNQTDQKKFIGNSVVPLVVTEWTLALGAEFKTIPFTANSQAA